jgi:seryl-tRNA synthetase
MLDIKQIRENPDDWTARLKRRDPEIDLEGILNLDSRRRAVLTELEALRSERKKASKAIGEAMKSGGDVKAEKLRVKEMGERISSLEKEESTVSTELSYKVSLLPNPPHESVPADTDKRNNVVVRTHLDKEEFTFEPKNHMDLNERLNLFDFEGSARVSGSHFAIYIGDGARLEWALINWLWQRNIDSGYTPMLAPMLVNEPTMFSSGNLPKFADQAYRAQDDDLFMVPTSEVVLTGLNRDQILAESDLPLKMTSYSTCFRREAGAHGAEERGLIRVHQFNKIENYRITTPETSYDALEEMTHEAEALVEALGLHFVTTLLVSGDLAQQAAKTYDIEVWLPGQGAYYEVSSVSNCTDYQARRGNIRYRRAEDGRVEFPHTLNGSALATSRLMVAILENGQREDGSVEIPYVLRPLMGGQELLTASS